MTKPLTTLAAAVTEAYLETGKAQTAEDLAARLAWTPQAVRRRMVTSSGALIEGVAYGPVQERQTVSRNYPGFETGRFYTVKTYLPTLWRLRSEVIGLRARIMQLTETPAAEVTK